MATAAQHQPKLRGDAGHAGTVVATYDSYVDAERAVDRLSDAKFPVENTEIVGRDLRLVEQVTGRMTLGRATLMGLGAGAWIGLLIGLLIGIFTTTTSAWAAVVLWGVLIGAVWGRSSASSRSGRRTGAGSSRPRARSSPSTTT
jgi:hypothetical protein